MSRLCFRRYWLAPIAVLALATAVQAQPQPQQRGHGDDDLRALRPGEFVVHKQTVPVDLVFIGYDRSDRREALLDALPATYSPIVRFPQFYGLNGRDIGLEFRFKYQSCHKSRTFENQFFSFLDADRDRRARSRSSRTSTTSRRRTCWTSRGRCSTSTRRRSSGSWPATTAATASAATPSTSSTGTAGSDFRFHVYTKTDEARPRTDYNFGTSAGRAR